MVLALEAEAYATVGVFGGMNRIVSPTFPELVITSEELFAAVE
ncbi:hypothetical protein NIES4106_57630 (plasmid) [Fischerella sp. NIES-4106]|nr:hypothetical protein NIES4106_57630 [Fischerella sp. NIES-4106]